jgi:hypothetical protein
MEQSHTDPSAAQLRELRHRAKQLGRRLSRRRGFYLLTSPADGAAVAVSDIDAVSTALDLIEGKVRWRFFTACGMSIPGLGNCGDNETGSTLP